MTVNFEVKGMLARLLATEDIVVEHRTVETACFNVHTRVLTLPLWEKATDNIYSMLVAHEVGHARETPNEEWTSCQETIPTHFVNVVEDARVEKLMKRRYAGLAKTFYSGYKELHEQDFFQLNEKDVSTYNLADRANLFFKIGNFISLNFNDEEKKIVNLIAAAETFEDVLKASEILYNYCKNELNGMKMDLNIPDITTIQIGHGAGLPFEGTPNGTGMNIPQEGKGGDTSPLQEDCKDSNQPQNGGQDSSSSPMGGGENSNNGNQNNKGGGDDKKEDLKEPEVHTMNTLEDKIRQLIENADDESVYIEIPSVYLDAVIGKNSEVHSELQRSYDYQMNRVDGRNIFKSVDYEYKKFKTSAQKEVNYLIKEFECKKAADSYSRASISRTGVLDCSRLHSYKYTEDLFKKVATLAEGKNHGLVFILDWSGSMSNVMMDTIKQLYNLVWFCKKVSLPFEVYAFTNEWARYTHDYEAAKTIHLEGRICYQKRENVIDIGNYFSLMNLLTSKVSSSVLEKQLINIWRLACAFSDGYRCHYSYPARFSLSGTPLNESLICLHEILPQFQKENKLQKVQCIVLTDGEGAGLSYMKEIKQRDGSSYLAPMYSRHNQKCFLRDRKLGTTYKMNMNYSYHSEETDVLLRHLRDKFPSVNFIGIRVLESRDAHRFMTIYYTPGDKEYQKIQNDWKKLRSFGILKSGYHTYFGISANSLSQDSSFTVADDASKTQIKTAFVNSLKTKKTNKKILSEFISLIA